MSTYIDPLRREYIDEAKGQREKKVPLTREQLEKDMAKFLKSGGKVDELKPGESGYVVRGNKRAERSPTMARNSTTSVRDEPETYEGSPCWNCRSTTRYLSSRNCVHCANNPKKLKQVAT